MSVHRFSGQALEQLRDVLLHATDAYCNACENCIHCDSEWICDELAEMLHEACRAEVLCITVTREK